MDVIIIADGTQTIMGRVPKKIILKNKRIAKKIYIASKMCTWMTADKLQHYKIWDNSEHSGRVYKCERKYKNSLEKYAKCTKCRGFNKMCDDYIYYKDSSSKKFCREF